jgi:hypothetical protein
VAALLFVLHETDGCKQVYALGLWSSLVLASRELLLCRDVALQLVLVDVPALLLLPDVVFPVLLPERVAVGQQVHEVHEKEVCRSDIDRFLGGRRSHTVESHCREPSISNRTHAYTSNLRILNQHDSPGP